VVTLGCYSTTSFITTNDFLDWGAPSPNGFGGAELIGTYTHTVNANDSSPWTTNTNSGSDGVSVGLQQAGFTGTPILQRYDNVASISDGTGGYFNAGTIISNAQSNFASPPNPSTQYNSVATPYYGDHLIAWQSSPNSIMITFTSAVYAVGFRISSKGPQTGDASQELLVQAYGTGNPTPAPGDAAMLSYQLHDPTGYGTCATLGSDGTSTPNPCNNAPYIGIDTSNPLFGTSAAASIKTIVISSLNNPNGFYIDQLFIQDVPFDQQTPPGNAPEPGTTVLIGSGLVAAGMLTRRKRNAKNTVN